MLRLSDLPDGESQWIWMRLAGERTISLTGDIWKLDGLTNELQLITFEVAAVIGMMALMTVACLLLGISPPDRKFLWYSAGLGVSTLLFLSSENLLVDAASARSAVAGGTRTQHRDVPRALLTSIDPSRIACLNCRCSFARIGWLFRTLIGITVIACAGRSPATTAVSAPALNVFRLIFAVTIVVLCAILVRRGMPSAWPNFIWLRRSTAVPAFLHFAKNLDWLPTPC